ncbi:hypothetical protein [Pseudoalteromonas sp. MMG007]|uniref:hypothetical protein n=1 Tax=Pseudoalteromonas sp. MMG007 TaxID=2822684 RepID=UPI001B3758D0|nr:hypothetical protein [Pseudoalteromonas sp. MMG007]MBQ4860026.1 hypothetical protein [Pseudoalteromonas sp. MMG007]
MKTTYIVFLVIIAAGLGLWYSIDVLSNTTLLIEKNGEFYRDGYTTAERFFALWPVSIIGGLILAIVIGVVVLITFNVSKESEVKELKAKLENQISHYEQLKIQCLSDVKNANELANKALGNARTQAELEVEQERTEIEAEKQLISKTKVELNEFYQKVKSKSDEVENTRIENNKLIEHYKREMKITKQKARNHGNALERRNNFINRLKNDAEYLNSFIEENYET